MLYNVANWLQTLECPAFFKLAMITGYLSTVAVKSFRYIHNEIIRQSERDCKHTPSRLDIAIYIKQATTTDRRTTHACFLDIFDSQGQQHGDFT
jgi:hypothetical protein